MKATPIGLMRARAIDLRPAIAARSTPPTVPLDAEQRISNLGTRLLEWAQRQAPAYRLEAIRVQALMTPQLYENPAIQSVEVAFSGPRDSLASLLAGFGVAVRFAVPEIDPPPYEGSPAYDEPVPPRDAAPQASLASGALSHSGALVVVDDEDPPPPPPSARELVRDCVRRLNQPNPAAPARRLESLLHEAIRQIRFEGNAASQLRLLDALAADMVAAVPSGAADKLAVAMVARVLQAEIAPAVRALGAGHAPARTELLALVNSYSRSYEHQRAFEPLEVFGAQASLPPDLLLELDFCLAQFSTGQARVGKSEWAWRVPALLSRISHECEPRVQIDAFTRIYHALQNTPQKNPNDSRRFARMTCTEHLLPAVRRLDHAMPDVDQLRTRLLNELESR